MFVWYSQTCKKRKVNVKVNLTYYGQGIAFDGEGSLSFGHGFARNISSSYHTDNQTNIFLVLGGRPTDGTNYSLAAAEKN